MAPTAPLFGVFVGLVAGLMAVLMARRLPRGRALVGLAILAAWLAYDGLLSRPGLLAASGHGPPGMALLAGPPSALALLIGLSPAGRALARAAPLPWLIGLQSFRIGVELALLALAQAGQIPRLLTLTGGNVEILIGLTAPLVAWIAARGAGGRRIALLWNLVGLVSLANVSVRAALTAPGPLNLLHAEVPNLAMASFPFSYIPGFLAPLALLLHLLALRAPAGSPPVRSTRRALA
jgi:hypothetical protein